MERATHRVLPPERRPSASLRGEAERFYLQGDHTGVKGSASHGINGPRPDLLLLLRVPCRYLQCRSVFLCTCVCACVHMRVWGAAHTGEKARPERPCAHRRADEVFMVGFVGRGDLTQTRLGG